MAKKVTVSCAECERPIELQKRSLTRYYKRNNTDEYVCASCTASKTGKRPISDKEREKRSRRATALWQDEDYRRKTMIAHQQVTSQTEFKKKVAENNKKRWANLEYRKKMEKALSTPEVSQKISEKSKENWEDDAYRERVLRSKFSEKDLEDDSPN